MKVLLRERVRALGEVGDVVSVADGYARNYLLPRNIAMELNKRNLEWLEAEKKRRAQRLAAMRDDMKLLAEQIEKVDITLTERTHGGDNLYGAVQAREVVEGLGAEGLHVDVDMIEFEEPIKKLGVHTVKVHLHPEVVAEAKVWVVEKRETAEEDGEEG